MGGLPSAVPARSSGGGIKKALFRFILLALPIGGGDAAYDLAGARITSAIGEGERYMVGRVAQASESVAPQLTPQAAAGGGEIARRAMQACVEMKAAIAAADDNARGAMKKTMSGIAKSAEQLPIGLERIARSKPQSRAHYKEMLLRYFGRNCAAIAELFRGEREIER